MAQGFNFDFKTEKKKFENLKIKFIILCGTKTAICAIPICLVLYKII